jgi:hypothetical protein
MDKLIKVSFKDGRYHRAIPGEKQISMRQTLFDTLVIVQTALDDLHSLARIEAKGLKDKPMTVAKNHIEPTIVAPGEIVQFPTSAETAEKV